jgi:hypothetical protein
MRKAALTLAVCAGVLLASVTPVFAQQYPPPRPPNCNARDHSVEPGQDVKFGGRRWKKDTTVEAGFHQKGSPGSDTQVSEFVQTDSTGQFETFITVPEDVRNGDAVFGAQGKDKRGNIFRCIVPVHVVGADEPAAASTSQPAGITTGMLALAILVLFTGFLAVRRHRRTRALVG